MKFSILIILISLFIISSCSQYGYRQDTYLTERLETVSEIILSFKPAKVIWANFERTLFVSDSKTSLIYIYKDNQQVNAVGGPGFGVDNFNRLTDIAVSPHGKLLALDSFQKQIKQFDNNGKWLENHTIVGVQEPYLFDVGRDGTLYVYDKAYNEIVMIDEQLKEVLQRFGKFYFDNPVSVRTSNQMVIVYDEGKDQTFIFDSYGRLEKDLSGYWQVDRYNKRYLLQKGKILIDVNRDEQKILTPQTIDSFTVKENYLYQTVGNRVIVTEIVYKRFNLNEVPIDW